MSSIRDIPAGPLDEPITELLLRFSDGDVKSRDRLFELLQPQLHKMAVRAMDGQPAGQTLQPTALVNELAIRLLKSGLLAKLDSRWALYDVASRTIRSVLVDYARRRSAAKRPTGNGRECSSLDEMVDAFEQSQNIDVLALNDALEQLEVQHERAHSIVTLRFFGGMKFMDIAEHLGVSVSTVEKDWRFARCWLLRILDDDRDDAL